MRSPETRISLQARRILQPKSDTETRCAQIEKELLAATWTCEKMHMFLSGLPSFELHLDHKPLIPLVNTKNLVDASIRCQRMLLRLMRYNATAVFVPGKQHLVPDFLSRHPLKKHDQLGAVMQEDVHGFCERVFNDLPATPQRLVEISKEQQAGELLQRVVQQTLAGWKEGVKHGKPEPESPAESVAWKARTLCNYKDYLCNYKLFDFVKLASGLTILCRLLNALYKKI